MKNKKLLFVLLPIILILILLIAGVVYLKINSTPEKIFKAVINKSFETFGSSNEQNTTMKGTMKLTASVDSDDEEMQSVSTMLEGASIVFNMEVDEANMLVNSNIDAIYNNESLLNVYFLLQDQKGYIYLPDWLDKYLELPEDYLEDFDFTESSEEMETLDYDKLMDAIKEELTALISTQELTQGNSTLVLDGRRRNNSYSFNIRFKRCTN